MVLLGDAAHCPSPFSGMGTTGGLIGAYVLAGEMNRNSEDLPRAFANYDKTLRPFGDEIQRVRPSLVKLCMPKTAWGIAILHFIFGLLCFLRIPDLVSRFSKERDGDWRLPDYPELEISR